MVGRRLLVVAGPCCLSLLVVVGRRRCLWSMVDVEARTGTGGIAVISRSASKAQQPDSVL